MTEKKKKIKSDEFIPLRSVFKSMCFFSNYHLECVRIARTYKPLLLLLQIAMTYTRSLTLIHRHTHSQSHADKHNIGQSCEKACRNKKRNGRSTVGQKSMKKFDRKQQEQKQHASL